MANTMKITTVGNSVGIVLPHEILERLRVEKGDTLYALDTPNGIELTAYDPDFAEQMTAAQQVIREDRDALPQTRGINEWLQTNTVLAIHKLQIAEHGGGDRRAGQRPARIGSRTSPQHTGVRT